MVVRVVIAGARGLSRDGLRAILQAESDIEVVGEAPIGDEAITNVPTVQPDVVLVDTSGYNGEGAATTRAFKRSYPDARVLILSPGPDQEHFRQVMEAGASGYELLDISASHLANAIRAVHGGKFAINQSVIRQMAEGYATRTYKSPQVGHPPYGLTPRETQVLSKLAAGLSDKEIAAKLYLSESTVKSHLRIIYMKLKIHNRAQAATFAVQRGLLPPL